MKPLETIDLLSDGHSIYKVEKAQEICQALKLTLPDNLIIKWNNRQDALKKYGFHAGDDKPASGVYSLSLSKWVATQLLGNTPGSVFHGRGSQARANAEVIKKKLNL